MSKKWIAILTSGKKKKGFFCILSLTRNFCFQKVNLLVVQLTSTAKSREDVWHFR